MNTYEIERIDRNGNPTGNRKVTADSYIVADNGLLTFIDKKANELSITRYDAVTVAFLSPGTWGMVTLIDPAVSVPNTTTHPAATADEMDALIRGATITTTHDDKWPPITGSAVYNPDIPQYWRESPLYEGKEH